MSLRTLFLLTSISSAAFAEVTLPAIFADQMVLQRDAAIPVWGTAAPREKVTVELGAQSLTATAGPDGKWSVTLAPIKASMDPFELKAGSRTIHDVLVGEVWLAGGQSNMGYPVSSLPDSADVLAQATDPALRFFTVTKKTAAEPQPDLAGKWEASTPQTAKGFSAVGYFFARELRRKLNCPVAVINASWGGTPIETWISIAALQKDPPLTSTLQSWDKAVQQHAKIAADPSLAAQYETDLKRWRKEVEPVFNAATKAWNANPTGPKPTPSSPEPQNPDPMGMPSPSRRPGTPSISYNAMVAPIAGYAMQGVIWYQGEANGGAGLAYRELFPRLIQAWRAAWKAEFPFLFVQLPANGKDTTPVATAGWPWLREAQQMTLREPRTGMAIAIDVGNPNDVHPARKIEVGQRLALQARRVAYSETLVASGPLYGSYKIESGKIRVSFTETGSGLTPGQAPWRAPGVEPLPTDHLTGFYIAGEDHQWVAAEAKLDGASVVVSSPEVPNPVAVRYGWANSPRCNLYNQQGLPAAPFRTDDWAK